MPLEEFRIGLTNEKNKVKKKFGASFFYMMETGLMSHLPLDAQYMIKHNFS